MLSRPRCYHPPASCSSPEPNIETGSDSPCIARLQFPARPPHPHVTVAIPVGVPRYCSTVFVLPVNTPHRNCDRFFESVRFGPLGDGSSLILSGLGWMSKYRTLSREGLYQSSGSLAIRMHSHAPNLHDLPTALMFFVFQRHLAERSFSLFCYCRTAFYLRGLCFECHAACDASTNGLFSTD